MEFKQLSLALFLFLASNIKTQGSGQIEKNTCTPGKCGVCVLTNTSTGFANNCGLCVGSRHTSNLECSGTSTGIDNCVATTYDNTSTGTNATKCLRCKENYHLNMESNSCYSPSETANCASEVKISFFGFQMAICSMCKNGFRLKEPSNSTDETNRILQETFEMVSCETGKNLNNCIGQGANDTCLACELGYYLKNSSNVTTCLERNTLADKMCGDGNSTTINGETYCNNICNSLDGYYAVSGGVLLSNGTMVQLQKCEYVELNEDQKRERGFIQVNYLDIFGLSFLNIFIVIIFKMI